MAVTTTHALVEYNGNGVTTNFTVTFQFFAAADLRVIAIDADENEVVKQLTTHYTVSGGQAADGTPSTGSITMLVAPAGGTQIRIERSTPQTQPTTHANNDAFPAKTVEAAYDRRTLIEQELQRDINRSLGGTVVDAEQAAQASLAAAAAAEASAGASSAFATAASGSAVEAANNAAITDANRTIVEGLASTLPLDITGFYPDTTAGLAASSEGQYFAVPGAAGAEAYATLYREVSSAAVAHESLPSSTRINRLAVKHGVNVLPFGFFDGRHRNPTRRNNAVVAEVPESIPTFRQLGFRYMLVGAATNEFVRYLPSDDEKEFLLSQTGAPLYVCGGFFMHDAVSPQGQGAIRIEGNGNINIQTESGRVTSRIQVAADTYMAYEYGQMPEEGSSGLAVASDLVAISVGYTSNASEASRSTTGFFLAFRDTPWTVADMPVLQRAVSEQMERWETRGPKLVLAGPSPAESYVEAQVGPHLFRRSFRLRNDSIILPSVLGSTLNPSSETTDGVLWRTMTDDNSPATVSGLPMGGQHGFGGGKLTDSAHGKASADIGSVWSFDGDEYVLLDIIDANNLLMVTRNAISIPPTGTYTHVSGATNTADIVATVSAAQQWHPTFMNYRMCASVGDLPLEDVMTLDEWPIPNGCSFQESYDVLARTTVIEHAVATGAGWEDSVTGTPLFTMSASYHFDAEANMVIPTCFSARSSISLTRLVGLQVQWSSADEWYIPDVDPITHETVPYNFALIEPVPETLATEIVFNASNSEPGWLTRFISFRDNNGIAVGFLPVQDCEPTRRLDLITGSNRSLEIATTRKAYLHAVSKGAHTVDLGDSYSYIGYRVTFVRDSIRTCLYHVRSGQGDFLFVDWHDKAFIDTVPLPPDFSGRPHTVVKSRNVTIRNSSGFNGYVLADVDAVGDYGYLILKF